MLMLKKTIAALSLLSILAACQNDENPSQPEPKPRQDINLTRAEQEFMYRLCFPFLRSGVQYRKRKTECFCVSIECITLFIHDYERGY